MKYKFMHYYVWSIILFRITNSTITCERKDPSGNVIEECCADYEEINSTCVECKVGFTSNTGQKCRPCGHNTYGPRCSKECTCSVLQRCDHIHGCMNISKTTLETTFTVAATGSQSIDFTTDFDRRSSSTTITGGTDSSNVNPELSLREVVVYYTLSLVVVILLLFVCFLIRRQKKRRASTIITPARDRNNHDAIRVDQLVIEDNLYEVIDDHEGIDEPPKVEEASNDYLEVINESHSSDSSSGGKTTRNSYINPYESCISTENMKSSYEKLQQLDMGLLYKGSHITMESYKTSDIENIASQHAAKFNEKTIKTMETETFLSNENLPSKSKSTTSLTLFKCKNTRECGNNKNSLESASRRRHKSY